MLNYYIRHTTLNGIIKVPKIQVLGAYQQLLVWRAVGFKLSEGMEIPEELEKKFKFARRKSKLAGTLPGSFFKIKGEY